MPNSFGEILFEKPKNLQRMYELINVLHPVILQFLVAVIFLVTDSKSWNLHKLHKMTSSFNFWTKLVYTYFN